MTAEETKDGRLNGLSSCGSSQQAVSPVPASIPDASNDPLRLDGYYIGFDATGVFEIDLILSAVACAGKAFHHTADWQDECPPYDHRFRGAYPVDWIQNAANDAAQAIEARRAETGTGSVHESAVRQDAPIPPIGEQS